MAIIFFFYHQAWRKSQKEIIEKKSLTSHSWDLNPGPLAPKVEPLHTELSCWFTTLLKICCYYTYATVSSTKKVGELFVFASRDNFQVIYVWKSGPNKLLEKMIPKMDAIESDAKFFDRNGSFLKFRRHSRFTKSITKTRPCQYPGKFQWLVLTQREKNVKAYIEEWLN